MAITTYPSMSTPNEKELNTPIKRQCGLMDKKTRPLHILPTINLLQMKRHTQTKSNGIEKDIS